MIEKVKEHKITAQKDSGRAKLTWDEEVKRDQTWLGMEHTNTHDRLAWRGRLRPRLGNIAAPSSVSERFV